MGISQKNKTFFCHEEQLAKSDALGVSSRHLYNEEDTLGGERRKQFIRVRVFLIRIDALGKKEEEKGK